jgi:hypothetical protein
MKKVLMPIVMAMLIIGLLQGCSKSSNAGGGGTTSTTDTTKMLPSPYYLTCTINGVAKSFAADPQCYIDTVSGLLGGSTYVYIGQISFSGAIKTITSNVIDSVETFGIHLQYDSFKTSPGGNFSYLVRTYGNTTTAFAFGQQITVVSHPYPLPYVYGFIGPDSTSSGTSSFSVSVTSIDATSIKGTFKGILIRNPGSSQGPVPVTIPSTETITNGAFYMPYTVN